MGRRDDVLDWLEQVNPIPDPRGLYEDPETSRLFHFTAERRIDETLTDTAVDQLTRKHGRPLVRTGLLVGAAAAALIIIVGAVIAFMAAGSVDVVGSDSRVLQLTISGEECSYDGPRMLPAGEVEIVYHNLSSGTRWANTIRLDETKTVQDIHDYIAEDPLAGAPSWSAPVHSNFIDVRASSSAGPVVRTLEPGMHILLCGSSTNGAVFGADVLVTP